VEVYFAGYGWVEFEPTAGRAAPDYGSVTLGSVLPTAPAPVAGRFSILNLLNLLLWLGALTLLGLVVWMRRRWRRMSPRAAIDALYWQTRRLLAGAGLSAPTSFTPDEFLTLCATPLAPRPALLEELRRLTRLYVQAAFSPHEMPPAHLNAARMWLEWAAYGVWQRLGRP
jgi:hypothetical protein